jgi:hypothetical protein
LVASMAFQMADKKAYLTVALMVVEKVVLMVDM